MLFAAVGCNDDPKIERFGLLLKDNDHLNSAIVENYLGGHDKTIKIDLNEIEFPNEKFRSSLPKQYEAYLSEAEARTKFKEGLYEWFDKAHGEAVDGTDSYSVVFSLESKVDGSLNILTFYDNEIIAIKMDDEEIYYDLNDRSYEDIITIYNDYIDTAMKAFVAFDISIMDSVYTDMCT